MSTEPPIDCAPAANKSKWRSPWSAYRVSVLVIAGLVACVLVHLKLTYDKAITDAETLIEALSVASEQHIGGSLEAVDALLDELAATVREGRQNDPQFVDDLTARLPSYPEIRYIGLVGADGRMQPRTWPAQALGGDRLDVSDRKYFTAQRDASGPARLVVGEPVSGHAGGDRSLPLSRPIRDKAGRFAGVVVAAINPDVYAGFLSSILYDEAGSCGLISQDGRMIARAPNHAREFGRDIGDSDLIRLWVPRKPSGIAHLVAKTDANDKLLAYRLMPEFALMVTAGISRGKALAAWYRMAAVELPLLITFSGMLLYWTRRIQRHNAQLAAEQSTLEDAVRQRSGELETARALAESRAVQLSRINDELKRLTLVASHHLQEPLRSIVSCSQMVARSLSGPQPEVEHLVERVCADGLALKARLGAFETRVTDLTRSMVVEDGAVAPPATVPAAPAAPGRAYTARAVAIAIGVALMAGNALQMRTDYDAAIGAAENLTWAVVKSIAQHLHGSFRRIDNLLNDVVLATEDGRVDTEPFRERLMARLGTMPELRMVALADATGRISSHVWPDTPVPAQGLSIADRDYFHAQASAPRRGQLVVGRPRLGAMTGERSIQFTHPLLGPQGRFNGLAIASVNPDLYARFLKTVLLDENGATAVITLSGHILARAPRHEEKFGIDIANSDLFVRYLPRASEGIAHLVSKADGNDKLLGYRVIPGFPLVVTSGYSRAKALDGWRIMAGLTSGLALVATTILYLWAHRADRHARRLSRYRRELAVEIAHRTAGLAAAHHAAETRSRRMADANDRLHDLIRLIAAELQSPLAAMSAQISHLHALAGGRNDECDHWLGFITAGDIHLQALLRDYPRFVAALCVQPRPGPVDCAAVVDAAISHIRAQWDERRIRFAIAPLPTVTADAAMLHEVFVQLFDNAAAHARARLPVTVTISAAAQGDGCRITISDDGPGLPPINGDYLFRAFETAHDRNPDSTGLGLPLCRVIVQSHGGRIWATSRPGKGCDIHFTLPAAAAAAATEAAIP